MQAYHPHDNSFQNIVIEQQETWKRFIAKEIFSIPETYVPSAWTEHIPFAFWLIQSLQPGSLVELGTHYGMSYFSFCQAIKNNNISTRCYAIDTWNGDEHAGFYNDDIFLQVENNNQPFESFSTLYRLSFDEALILFENGSIDLLHIDGLHTYEAVKHDFYNWLPKMSDKGIVLFHDIAVKDKDFGVYRLWEELKCQYAFFEFEHGHGLGILATGNQISPAISPLFSLENTPGTKALVQNTYKRLGSLFGFELAIKLSADQEKTVRENQGNTRLADEDESTNQNIPATNTGIHTLDSLTTQVFWKEEFGLFTENNSVTQTISLREDVVHARFSLKDIFAPVIIKINPATAAGGFYLHAIYVTDQDEVMLANWQQIRMQLLISNLLFTKSGQADNVWLALSLTSDPMIEFMPGSIINPGDKRNLVVHIEASALTESMLEKELSRLSVAAFRS